MHYLVFVCQLKIFFKILNIAKTYVSSVTNYFLVNLSISDLLVTLLCMPMAVGQATYSLWVYGDFMCKLTNYLQGMQFLHN